MNGRIDSSVVNVVLNNLRGHKNDNLSVTWEVEMKLCVDRYLVNNIFIYGD